MATARGKYQLATRAPRTDAHFESRWTTVRGIRIHDRASLNPPPKPFPVVLVHGLSVSHRYLMPLARALAPHFPVRVVDLPGFGLSGDPGTVLELPELADWLGEWMTAAQVAPAVILGNSFGCQVAVELAVRPPRLVLGLVLVGPTMDRHARSAPRQILRWVRDLRHEDLFQVPIIMRDLADAGVYRAAKTFRIALQDRIEDKLPDVLVPALVTRGDREPVISPRWVEDVAALLPEGRLAIIPGSPHDANYTAADRLASVVVPFLDRLAA